MSILTPACSATFGIKFLPGKFQEATAPSLIDRLGSVINLLSSNWRTLPVPPQRSQAPSELKEKSSALGT